MAVSDSAAYGMISVGGSAGVGVLDLTNGSLRRIAALPAGNGGLGGAAASGPWLVWQQFDSQNTSAVWSVHSWNRETGRTALVATSALPGGHHLAGAPPMPVVWDGKAAWPQPVGATGPPVVHLQATDLASGRTWILDTGLISSPVLAGNYLVWGKVTAGHFGLRAVNARTLAPAAVPGLPGNPGSIGYLAGSPEYLAWSNQDGTTVTVLRFATSRTKTFVAADGRHHFQFLQLAGHYLLWYSGITSAVLDLSSGAGFDAAGSLAGDDTWLVWSQDTRASAAQARISAMLTAGVPRIPSCPA
ncbi:MAG TPA: hypothetical protein VKU39_00915 [Streptosporangiaceae bacterium]|nr:hypothetical protein [Streptosporangiaceae bacterium]